MRITTTFAAFVAAAFVLAGTGTATEAPEARGLDPATLPFVPSPVLDHDLAPGEPGESCVGNALYSTGNAPPWVERVTLRIESDACGITHADVTWTVLGHTYRGDVDPVTGAVTGIVEIASAPMAATIDTGGQTGTGGVCSVCGPAWTYVKGHVWLHFWAKSGSGNENVKTNHNWRYAGQVRETTEFWTACDADGVWRVDECTSASVNGQSARGHGAFHAVVWPSDYHTWDTYHTIQPDQTSGGKCVPAGELPWNYGATCDVGAGNL